ncbi:hypothetical protein LTSEMON_1501, partial [Salmonella enterica subsp. enterica serovar Montevideo str. S5-403]
MKAGWWCYYPVALRLCRPDKAPVNYAPSGNGRGLNAKKARTF